MHLTKGSSMSPRGVFITFEGVDGAGKTTQIRNAREWFEARGFEVVMTCEPGGTPLGAELRRLVQNGPDDIDPRTEALLYAADRAYHVATVVRPALARGAVVLGDRYIDSSLAYQGAARSLGVDEIAAMSAWATEGLSPCTTFLLDLPPEVGAGRRTDAPDRMERESADFHERVRREYLRLADAEPDRIVVIDAVGTREEVFSEIRGVLVERFADSAPVSGAPSGSGGGPAPAQPSDPERGAPAPVRDGADDSPDQAPASRGIPEPERGAPVSDQTSDADRSASAQEDGTGDEAAPVRDGVDHGSRGGKPVGDRSPAPGKAPSAPAPLLGEAQGALWEL